MSDHTAIAHLRNSLLTAQAADRVWLVACPVERAAQNHGDESRRARVKSLWLAGFSIDCYEG